MKYFTQDLFIKNLKIDSLEYQENDKLWNERFENYEKEFLNCLHRFPKSFVNYYNKNGFHDDILEKLEIIKRQTKNETFWDINSYFRNSKVRYLLKYINVKKFDTTLTIPYNYAEIGDYLVGEFLIVDDDTLSHEFYLYNDSKILIHFKKLSLKLLK